MRGEMETESKFDLTKSVDAFWKANTKHHAVDAVISPDYAWYMVTKHNYINQRAPSLKHAGTLSEAIRRGAFRNYTSIEFAILDGTPHLINGQHTLHAIAGAGKPVPLCIHFHRVANVQEIENLYSLYDNGRLRSIRDVSSKIGEELGLNVKERDVFAVAVNLINLGFTKGGNDSPSQMFEAKNFEFRKQLMREYLQEAKTVFAAIQGAPAYNVKLFMRGPILGVAILTVKVDMDKATEFWRGAAMDDGLKSGDPRKALITWLRNQSKVQRQHQHLAAIACWNAWFDGRPLTRVFATTESATKIKGFDTPVLRG
jgi:hypothetical protein